MVGYLDSVETMGLVDGPGIRYVVFLNACKLRCVYCHNPETWTFDNSLKITSKELIKKINNYRHYYSNGGGVTFSGGEPLIQDKFLLEMLKECKKHNLHTAIDTCGVGNGDYKEILKYTDLVLLDIKSYDANEFLEITGSPMDEFNNFLNICQELDKEIWIRQVIVPNINDNEEYILGLKEYLSKIKNITKIELLPYHTLGKEKYKQLNIEYRLENTKDMDKERVESLRKLLD